MKPGKRLLGIPDTLPGTVMAQQQEVKEVKIEKPKVYVKNPRKKK